MSAGEDDKKTGGSTLEEIPGESPLEEFPGESTLVTRVINRPDHTSTLQVRKARIKVIRGDDRGLEKDLHSHGVVIGSSPACDLVLRDPSVSRRHCEIAPADVGFRLRDLGSMNGTFIDEIQVRDVFLRRNQELQVGNTRLRFQLLKETEEYPLSTKTALGRMLGRSLALRQVFAILERSADSDSTVLLEGESGTGKDLAAETIHQLSRRRDRPFAVVDCGAMKSTLVESELFGHRKGAFTGADRDHAGAFESAEGGTVFLDEIGEIDPALQPKLLRLLENREVKRLGENNYRPVDIRLIAATNRDLSDEVKAGRFRQDLFFRISVVRLRMPPLRDRREDISMLARSFVQHMNPNVDPLEVINDQVLSLFLNHDWPGNVRELRNVVERLLLFPEKPESAIQQSVVGRENSDLMALPFHEARNKWVEQFERAYLTAVLDAAGGVVSQAAKVAEIPRQTFYRLITKHRLEK